MIYNTIAVVQSNENNHYCVWANLQAGLGPVICTAASFLQRWVRELSLNENHRSIIEH
jgi:hypothetical protein